MTKQLAEARQTYEEDAEVTQLKQKKQNNTLKDLAELIEDTVDEIIGAVRKEKTNFDNAWLPTHEVELDYQSTFVKYVGFNLLVVQDNKFQLYFFSGDELLLQKKLVRKWKIQDAFGIQKYICLAFDQRNVQFLDRNTLDVVKAVRT